jgi:hypothetical protein
VKIADYGKAITSYIESPTTAQKLKARAKAETLGRTFLAEGSDDVVIPPRKPKQLKDLYERINRTVIGIRSNSFAPELLLPNLEKATQEYIKDGLISGADARKFAIERKEYWDKWIQDNPGGTVPVFDFDNDGNAVEVSDEEIIERLNEADGGRIGFDKGLSADMKKRIKNFETITGESYADQPAWKKFDIREGNWKGTGSKIKLTEEMKANIKEFETRTGLKYEDVDLQKKKAIRDGRPVGVLPTKKEMKLRISVNDKGVPIFPNKQMEKEFIKDIKNKFEYPQSSKNIPEDLKASGFAKKYPISERQVERATRYYKDKLNLKYPKGMDAPEFVKKRKEYIKKNSNTKFENFLKGNPEFHKSHMSDLYTQKVNTGTLGYAKANINVDELKDIDIKMNALYKKANKLLKDKPKNLNILLDEINQKGTDLAAQSGGYKKFEAIDPFTKKKFIINFSSAAQELDPTNLLGNKELSKLTEADKPLLKNLKDSALKNIVKGTKLVGKVIKPVGYAFGANAVKSAISKAEDQGLELNLVDKIIAFDSGDAEVALNNAKRRVDPEFAAAERAKDLAKMTDDFEEVGKDTTFGKYNDQIKNIKLP